jgi:hypothetical protein
LSKAIPTNTGASAKQRLLNRARAKKEDFNLLLTKYALERVSGLPTSMEVIVQEKTRVL